MRFERFVSVFYASHPEPKGQPMKNTKFLVKVNRGGARAAEYVQRIEPHSPFRPRPTASWLWPWEAIHRRRRRQNHAEFPL